LQKRANSFIAQTFDGIELRGTGGGDSSEDDAYQRPHHDGNERRPAIDGDTVVGEEAHRVGEGETGKDADDASRHRDYDGLREKLQADFAVGGANGFANPNLA